MLPNFLIVGASKSGTTSLYYYLKQHPEIFMSEVKEPHFFTRGVVAKEYDLEGYLSLFSSFQAQTAIARGEASTAYLYAPDAPGNIKKHVPEMKIIISLRNPVEMAYSLYWHMVRHADETLSFEEALAKEKERQKNPQFALNANQYPDNYFYKSRVNYVEQVKRYLDLFGDQVLILLYEELQNDPIAICKKIYHFLGTEDHFIPDAKTHYNKGIRPRLKIFRRLINTPESLLSSYSGFPGIRSMTSLLSALIAKPITPMADETRIKFAAQLAPDIKKLGNLIGRDLSDWMSPPYKS